MTNNKKSKREEYEQFVKELPHEYQVRLEACEGLTDGTLDDFFAAVVDAFKAGIEYTKEKYSDV